MRVRFSIIVGMLVALAAAAPTSAAGPTWFDLSVDDTFLLPRTSAACGFDVFERDEGQLKFQVMEYADGTLRFKDLAVAINQTVFAPSRGTSVALQPGGRGGRVFLVAPDGSVRELVHGTNGHVTVQGEGVIYMWAGSVRATFSPDGTVTEAQHGVIPDDASSLCPLLAG
jgi:hypothetical protein